MLGLSGKYAVTLYMLLESVANLQTPVLDVELSQLRQWLKVPNGKMEKWFDIKRFILEPAIKQINDNPKAAGFTVETEEIKDGRAVARVRFFVSKSSERITDEETFQAKTKALPPSRGLESSAAPLLPTSAYEQAKKVARGWDIYALESEWREWLATKEAPDYSAASFVAFCRKKGAYR
jgi:plasmid replication initiation protein